MPFLLKPGLNCYLSFVVMVNHLIIQQSFVNCSDLMAEPYVPFSDQFGLETVSLIFSPQILVYSGDGLRCGWNVEFLPRIQPDFYLLHKCS